MIRGFRRKQQLRVEGKGVRRGQRRLSGVFITNTDSPRFLSVQVPLDVKAGLGQQPIPPNSSKGLFDVVSQIREI